MSEDRDENSRIVVTPDRQVYKVSPVRDANREERVVITDEEGNVVIPTLNPDVKSLDTER